MRPYRPRSYVVPGLYRRSEFAPEDLVRSLERRRARFMPNVVVDPSGWDIARLVARELRGSHGEGLRGIFVPDEGEHGRLYWWPAHKGSHYDGRMMLGMGLDRSSSELLEVEANVHRDTTIFFQFGIPQSELDASSSVEAFMRHPTVSDQMDGCLARNGRLVLIDVEGRVRLSASAPAGDPHAELRSRREAAWAHLGRQAERWARSRRPTTDDGRAMPDRRSLASYRSWLRHGGWCYGYHPLPSVEFENGSIVLEWRGSDLHGTIRFDGTTMSSRTVMRGRWREEGPIDVSTPHRMRRHGLRIDDVSGMKDDEGTLAAAKNIRRSRKGRRP
jgi:hypothetical protein